MGETNGVSANSLRIVMPVAPPEMEDVDYLKAQFGRPRDELKEEQQQQWDRDLIQLQQKERLRQSLVSPRGALGLPPLLDERRLLWRIPDGAFQVAPLYDRIYLFQIPIYIKKKGLITMTEQKEKAELRTGARGVIVAAGLLALDALRSNGVDLGHIVRANHVNPWRLAVDFAEGMEFEVLVMQAGYLSGSEDLANAIRNETTKVTRNAEGKHVLADHEGNTWDPVMPWDPNETI